MWGAQLREADGLIDLQAMEDVRLYPYLNYPGKTIQFFRVRKPPHQFKLSIRKFSNRLDLVYVPILGTFISYENSLIQSFWSQGLQFEQCLTCHRMRRIRSEFFRVAFHEIFKGIFQGNLFQGFRKMSSLNELTDFLPW